MSGPGKWSLGGEPPEPATWPEPETQAEGDEKADETQGDKPQARRSQKAEK